MNHGEARLEYYLDKSKDRSPAENIRLMEFAEEQPEYKQIRIYNSLVDYALKIDSYVLKDPEKIQEEDELPGNWSSMAESLRESLEEGERIAESQNIPDSYPQTRFAIDLIYQLR